jgi:hypothetical protein
MNKIYTLACSVLIAASSYGQNIINITDASLVGGQTYNWTNNNEYILDGLVFLEDGGTLNIQPGTVIKFTPRADVGNPSALVICRGAKIVADGSETQPIIFTAQDDDVTDPTDLGPTDVSLHGGLVILGKGFTEKNGNTEVNVEGIPTSETRGIYGMPAGQANDADNSGILRYVSIRHGGREIATGSELNGLTLGAVGSGTIIDFIEIYANSDDGIEFFGGAVNVKHAVVAFSEDDSFDWDESWKGNGQFWFSIQRADVADSGYECDGSTPNDVGVPSDPKIFNVTHIGSGVGAAASNGVAMNLRAGTRGLIANSIFADMKGKGVEIQNSSSSSDAISQMQNGRLKFTNNIFWKIGSNSTLDTNTTSVIKFTSGTPSSDKKSIADSLSSWDNQVVPTANGFLNNIVRTQTKALDPRPASGSVAETAPRAPLPSNDLFFSNVAYIGAFSPNDNDMWIQNWSTLAKNEHLNPAILSSVYSPNLNVGVNMYPNPTKGLINFSSTLGENVLVSIHTINGQLLLTANINEESKSIDLNSFSKGLYIVKITNSKETLTKKLVIE